MPTTGTILLVLFVLVNVVPILEPAGDPENPSSANSRREGRRVFREQYGLDLPLLLDLRFLATADEVLAKDDDAIREFGPHGVIPLLQAAGDTMRDTPQRDRALRLLPACARESIRVRDAAQEQERKLERNREVARIEAATTALDEAKRNALVDDWTRFVESERDRFDPRGWSRVAVALKSTRLFVYLSNLAHLDFGRSIEDGQPVLPVMLHRLARSATLGAMYIVFSFAAAIPLGLFVASLRRRGRHRGANFVLYAVYSLPGFFVAILLQQTLAAGHPFGSFPLGGFHTNGPMYEEWGAVLRTFDVLHHMLLPVVAISLPTIVALTRLLDGALDDALRSDYVAAARAKGLSPRRVLFRHALRNALLPLATAFGNMVPVIVGGAATIEFVFDIPGVGSYLIEAVFANDFNVVLCVTLFSAIATQLGYLLSDLLYARLDPRIDGLSTLAPAGGAR